MDHATTTTAETTPAFAPPALATVDRSSRTVLAGAGAAIAGALVGMLVGAWDAQPFALVVIALARAAGGSAYAGQAMTASPAIGRHLRDGKAQGFGNGHFYGIE